MPRTSEQLRDDALAIWRAGLAAVAADRLIHAAVRREGELLFIADEEPFDLARVRRIAVVGAGKAGAGMATAIENVLGDELLAAKQVSGWLNVPADCVRPLRKIHLHAARPAGKNEPTPEGLAGSEEILRLVGSLSVDDLCIALISGGGSALLPAPVEGISLADKLAVTRHLSATGANIVELNTVRKQLSRIKGGGLARACRAGRLVTLVISDVLGDPLDLIGSGPTVPDFSTPDEALAILERFGASQVPALATVVRYLKVASQGVAHQARHDPKHTPRASIHVIGNNATAVDAAGEEAVRLGYSPAMIAATAPEGQAEEVGRHLADMALAMRNGPGPDCLISGGEPVVTLAPEAERGRGGRNQQLALAALERLGVQGLEGIVLISGGTDGEDGPTDAAGAIIDRAIAAKAVSSALDPRQFLHRNDAYGFFEQTRGLLKTGSTHTNVGDLRVVVVD
jgi:glycerate 2-kinase